MKVENKIRVSFGLALTVLLAVSIMASRSAESHIQTQKLADRARVIIDQLDKVFIAALDLHSSTHGYVITGQEDYLKGQNGAVGRINAAFANLQTLMANKPAHQRRRLETLNELIMERLSLCGERIEARRNQGLPHAASLVSTGVGSRNLEAIRRQIQELETEENRLLREQSARAYQMARVSIGVTASGFALAIGCVGLATLVINRDFRLKAEARKTLEQQAQLLDLAEDSIIVHDFESGRITYWNRGAERRYGWSGREASGKNINSLLQTEFPRPQEEITADLLRDGRWEGELKHVTRDGRRVILESRWVLKRDGEWAPEGILEINSDITARKQAEGALRELPRRIIEAQEQERRRVARELHDSINQILYSTRFRLQALEARLKDDPDASQEIARAAELLKNALQESRRISHNLLPSELDDLGLCPAIRIITDEFSERTGIRADLECAFTVRLPAEVELALYRIFQEALSNVEKHARATQVSISLKLDSQVVGMNITDNGCGFDPRAVLSGTTRKKGLGLINIQERSGSIKGTCMIESSVGKGTEIMVSIPRELADSNAESL